MLSWASAEEKRPANSRREAAPLSAVWRAEHRRGQTPRSFRRGALKASTTADCGFVAGRSRYWPSIHFPPGCSERSLDSAPLTSETLPKSVYMFCTNGLRFLRTRRSLRLWSQ